MPDHDSSCLLFAGARHIGCLEFDDVDWPFLYYTFKPTDRFEEVREIFEETTAEAWQRMDALDLRVVYPNGDEKALHGFILQGGRAVFRPTFFRDARRQATIAAHDAFWSVLGDEVGPEACSAPGCDRLRISLSVHCKRHHFRALKGEEYQGTPGDGVLP